MNQSKKQKLNIKYKIEESIEKIVRKTLYNISKAFHIYLLTIIIVATNCCRENPVEPKNNSPEILSLEVFPKTIGPTDSVIVICNAIEPDGDSLFYDWITTGIVRIKGTNYSRLYHTIENTRVFYPKQGAVSLPIDTLWVQCFVRDGKGEADEEMVCFYVKENVTQKFNH